MREARTGFDLWLGAGLDEAVRLVLVHDRGRRFRPAVLWEAPWVALAAVCLLPLRLLLVPLGLGMAHQLPAPLPQPRLRAFRYWHTIGLRVFGQDNQLLEARDATPSDRAALDRHVGSVLRAAHQRGLVVLEMFGQQPGQLLHAYFGGQPLMAAPRVRDEDMDQAHLEQAGVAFEDSGERVIAIQEDRRLPRAVCWLRLLALWLAAPLLAWSPGYRTWLKEAWLDARGVAPRRRILSVSAEGLQLSVERHGRVSRQESIEAERWLSAGHAPSVACDSGVTLMPPDVRIASRERSFALGLLPADLRQVWADWLVATTVRLRRGRPELGLRDAFRDGHCPHCASLYPLRAGSVCPTCAAPSPADGNA